MTASPPTMSPPLAAASTSPPSLPPLVTSGMNPTPTPRRTSSQRPTSYATRRISSYSSNSRVSQQRDSRPASYVFPAFHSSLPYTLVRDFAYPLNHPMHYGPPPTRSGMSTPASDSRRLSDPVVSSWDESRGHWSATPPWMDETHVAGARDQLPAMTFQDGGPPYSEDEDLHSPIVTSSRNRKHKSTTAMERGRSPGGAAYAGMPVRPTAFQDDGPGEAIENYPHVPQHRDSHFSKPLQRAKREVSEHDRMSEEDSETEGDDARFSKDYSFTIASPDEEMHGKAVALFDFESEHQNELALKEGQIILVSYRHGQGWLVAEDPRTGESGLVPEEFVRLVRDIEGGLNGLNAVSFDDNADTAAFSPISNDPGSANTPTPGQIEFPSHASRLSGDKHPPMRSTFSTSSKDFLPRSGETSPSSRSQS